jgi:hypothetical protein
MCTASGDFNFFRDVRVFVFGQEEIEVPCLVTSTGGESLVKSKLAIWLLCMHGFWWDEMSIVMEERLLLWVERMGSRCCGR